VRQRAGKRHTLANVLLWLVRRRKLYRVTGESMLPGLKPGELVFVDFNAYRQAQPQAGQVVVLYHPNRPDLKIIKRVTQVLDGGRYFVSGDNPAASTDSRSFGPVRASAIIGRVV